MSKMPSITSARRELWGGSQWSSNRVDPAIVAITLTPIITAAALARTLTAQHRDQSKRECHIERDGYRCAIGA
jgi:hypothetical protein